MADAAMSLQRAGVPPELIYDELLIPIARDLGRKWEEDECDFVDVTNGVWQLQNAQRALSPAFRGRGSASVSGPHVALMPLPGEQHTFGVTIVADHFARAGWQTWCGRVSSAEQAAALVQDRHFDLVGLSVACDEHIAVAERLIAQLRQRSLNPQMAIMVGGSRLLDDPALARRIGADGTAATGRQAVSQGFALIRQQSAVL